MQIRNQRKEVKAQMGRKFTVKRKSVIEEEKINK